MLRQLAGGGVARLGGGASAAPEIVIVETVDAEPPATRVAEVHAGGVSIATRLGDWSGRGYVGDQAEAGGACSSEHCSC